VAVEKPRYSLADEARFVLGHRKNAFEAGKKLRNMPVEFVSAGMLEGTIKEQQEVKAAVPDSGSESDDESIAPSTSSSMSPPDNTRAMAQMVIRSPSPALSEASSGSSDEVIFQGRGNSSAPLSMTTSRVESPLPQKQVTAVAEAVHNAVDVANAKAEAVAAQVAASASVPVEDVQVQPNINVSIRVKGIIAHSHVSLDHLIKLNQIHYLSPPSLLLNPTPTPALMLSRTPTLSPIVRSLNVVETRLDGRATQQNGNTGQSLVLAGCQSRIVSPWTRFSLMTPTLAMQLWTTTCRTLRNLV